MNTNAALHAVDGQLTPNNILDEKLLSVITRTHRSEFVPEAYKHAAYVDQPIEIAQDRMLLPPLTVGLLLKYAELTAKHRVLYVAGGYGYGPALVAAFSKQVCAVEVSGEASEHARLYFSQNRKLPVDVFTGALSTGHPESAPYDRIIIEGGVQQLPQGLLDQLVEGGICVGIEVRAKVGDKATQLGQLTTWHKRGDSMVKHGYGDVFAPLLPGFEAAEQFSL